MKTIHPHPTPTLFACGNCGAEHIIPAVTEQTNVHIDRCGVCVLSNDTTIAKGGRVEKFRMKQARARRAQR